MSRTRKPKPVRLWWQPAPKGVREWFFSVLEHLEDEETKYLQKKFERLGPDGFARDQFDYGENGRARRFVGLLSTLLLTEAERERLDLWCTEGWSPPAQSLLPDDDPRWSRFWAAQHANRERRAALERQRLESARALAGLAPSASPMQCNGDAKPGRPVGDAVPCAADSESGELRG